MAAYLEEHPPARSQYRKGRRAKPTGTIVLHTAENTPDLAGADSGAENIARFISQRTDAPGSYHLIGDRDSQILLVPFEWEAFQDGTGSNPWGIGISLAITAKWFREASNEQKLWYMARFATMARTASDWLEASHGITVPARRLTKASQREAGFCTHMDRENWQGTPGRRSDPWGNSDDMWHLFLTLYEDTANPTPAPAPADEEDELDANEKAMLRHVYNWTAALAGIQQLDPLDKSTRKGWAFETFDRAGQPDKSEIPRPAWQRWIIENNHRLDSLAAKEIARAVAAELGGSADVAAIEQATDRALRKVLGSLDA